MIVMPAPEAERPEMLICSLCERPAGRVMTFVPLCLRCRTAGYERVAAAEPKPIIVLLSPSAEGLLHDHLVSVALGLSAPSEAA
jgi:hypothetical protein